VRLVNLQRVELAERIEHGDFRAAGTRLADALGAKRIGGSIFEIAAGDRLFPYHYHHGVEEWLIVVDGTPTLRTAEGEQELRPGDCVCFPTGRDGAHALRGPGRVLMLSTGLDVSVSVYPDSDKIGARPAEYGDADRLDFRRGDAVDYWHGE
jgi:uncharacterized cupin superfamily protein